MVMEEYTVCVQEPLPSATLTVSCPATPKSASLAWPSVFSRMFPALISLWIFRLECKYSKPFRAS